MAGNNEKLDYGVIDDFLPSDVFAKLQTFLLYPELVDNSIPVPLWQYNSNVVQEEKKEVVSVEHNRKEKKYLELAPVEMAEPA